MLCLDNGLFVLLRELVVLQVLLEELVALQVLLEKLVVYRCYWRNLIVLKFVKELSRLRYDLILVSL